MAVNIPGLNPIFTTTSTQVSAPANETAAPVDSTSDVQGLLSMAESILGQAGSSFMEGALGAAGGNTVAGDLPEPNPSLGHAPEDGGLQLAEGGGWPKGSVKTAGGYTVVAQGNARWDIFAPGQKPSEKPMAEIWGDPHVKDADGSHAFDFSKSSDFLLPDGTRIACKTTSETGHSHSDQLDIVNGVDHVTITGVDGKPNTGNVAHDGVMWRESHVGKNENLDTYKMGGTVKHAAWFREKAGTHGAVTSSKYSGGSYTQTIDYAKNFWVDSSLTPPVGSKAYSLAMENAFADEMGGLGQFGVAPGALQSLTDFGFPGDVPLPQDAKDLIGGAYSLVGGSPISGGTAGSTPGVPSQPTRQDPASTLMTPFGGTMNLVGDSGSTEPNRLSSVLGWVGQLGDAILAFEDMMSGVASQRMTF